MSFNLGFLGLYPNAIENACDMCEEAIAGAKNMVEKYGSTNDYDILDVDLEEIAKAKMEENFNFDNMTNSIIAAYMTATISAFEGCTFLTDMGIHFEEYVNCDDTHLYMKLPDGSSISVVESDDVIAGINDVITDKLYEAIEDYLNEQTESEPEKEYPRDYVESDITDGSIDENDIREFFDTGKLNDNIISLVDEYAVNTADKEVVITEPASEALAGEAVFTLYEDMSDINDSLLMSSDTVIAEFTSGAVTAEIIVRGEVKVTFEDEDYDDPEEFPDELKELIRSDSNWKFDDRVYVSMNNWCELEIRTGSESDFSPEIVEVENTSPEDLYEIVADSITERYPDLSLPATLDDFTAQGNTYINMKEPVSMEAPQKDKPSVERE